MHGLLNRSNCRVRYENIFLFFFQLFFFKKKIIEKKMGDVLSDVVVIPVKGMTCNSVTSLTKVLTALPGVSKVNVSLANEDATITYDSSKLTKSTIIETIDNCGYEVK